jgi:hypothetical protein
MVARMNASSAMTVKKPASIIKPIKYVKSAKIKKTIPKRSPQHFSTTGTGHVFSNFIGRVTIRPGKQLTVPIGNTFTSNAPKGFSIGLSPGNETDETIVLEVTTMGTPDKYEYKLHIANNGTKTVNAEIWAL